jgi:hypothetical protein
MRKIIFFELNEVPFRVMDSFCEKYPTSTLAKIRPYCHEYLTNSEDIGLLEPWITWPSVHRGVSNQQHKIHDYNQDLHQIDENFPPVWKILSSNHISTGVFSSLHSYPLPANISDYSFFIPDPFAPESVCHPELISSFQEFNLSMSRISGKNVSSKMLVTPALKMLTNSFDLGLRPNTFWDISTQLLSEKVNPSFVRRRRTYQSVLSFDVFMKLLKEKQPSFATFFTNHVASSMHRYWGASFPDDFEDNQIDSSWKELHKNEIDFAMHKFDNFLSRLISFVNKNKDYKIVILGSIGQSANEPHTVSTMVLVKNPALLLEKMALLPTDWKIMPAMVPQFNVFVCESKQEAFRSILESLRIDEKPVDFRENEKGFFSIDFLLEDVQTSKAKILDSIYSFEEIGLKAEELQDKVSNTGWHVPEGAMLVYDAHNKTGIKNQKVSTLAICPSILENFGIDIPTYMSPERVTAIAS